jgi:hypothetical protein
MQQKERGSRPLGFERSEKTLGFGYHVGERCAIEYWIDYIEVLAHIYRSVSTQP